MMSQKALETAFPGHGAALRALLTGQRSPFDYPAVAAWRDQCYHEPRADRCDAIMQAVNVELDGYGDEPITGRYVDHYYQDIQACYVNMGDSYATTIVHDHETGTYRITTVGDWIERNERRLVA